MLARILCVPMRAKREGKKSFPFGGKRAFPSQARTGWRCARTSRRGNRTLKPETMTTAAALLSAGIPDQRERAEVLSALQAQADRRDRMLTTAAAAKFAGVHRKTLFAWERKGYLKPRRITPSRVRWSRNELQDFICETAEG